MRALRAAAAVATAVGYAGAVEWDRSKPDGTPRKLLDSTKIRALGWSPRIKLAHGMRQTYEWFVANAAKGPSPNATLSGHR